MKTEKLLYLLKKLGPPNLHLLRMTPLTVTPLLLRSRTKKLKRKHRKPKKKKNVYRRKRQKRKKKKKPKKRKKKRLPKKKLNKRLKQKLMLKPKPLRKLKSKLKQTLLPNKLNKNGLPLSNKQLQPSNLKRLLMLLIQTLENSILLLAEM